MSSSSLRDKQVQASNHGGSASAASRALRTPSLRAVSFDRTVREVLEHLRQTSPLAQWVVTRFDGNSMRIVQSIGSAFSLSPENELDRKDITGKLVVGSVRLRPTSVLVERFGVRSCVAAVVGSSARGTSAPFGAIIGLDPCDNIEISAEFTEQLRLHARHLEAALAEHHASFERVHSSLNDVDPINGFDSAATWSERVHLLDRHCSGVADDAAVAVIDVGSRAGLTQRFGHTVAEELLREISYALRSVCGPDAFFGVLDDEHVSVVRLAPSAVDAKRWQRDLRNAIETAVGRDVVSIGVGVAVRTYGQHRALEQAQARAQALADAR